MRHVTTTKHRSMFEVLDATASAQAAMMTLRPGQSSSDQPANEHHRAEQWVFVVKGVGRAVVGRKRAALKAGSLLLIEKGERHQITNTGRSVLLMLNLYCPPAYTGGGEVKRSARR